MQLLTDKLAIGTVQFGLDYGVSNDHGMTSLEDARKIVGMAIENNIRTFDTAPAYGLSESVLGRILPNDVQVVTKTINISHDIIESNNIVLLDKKFNDSLNQLGADSVYGLLVHAAGDMLKKGGEQIVDWLVEKKEQGSVNKVGVSIYTSDQIDDVSQIFNFDLIQLPMNILDQRLIQSGHLSKLKENDVEVHVRSVFLQGLLLMKPQVRPEYFAKYNRYLGPFIDAARELGVTQLELSLGFILNMPEVDKAVVGVNDLKQLEEIVISSKAVFDPNEFGFLACEEKGLLNPSLWQL